MTLSVARCCRVNEGMKVLGHRFLDLSSYFYQIRKFLIYNQIQCQEPQNTIYSMGVIMK